MTLRNILLNNSSFTFEQNVFCQKEIDNLNAFEKNYINLREREHRVYSDEVVRNLPAIAESHALRKEWLIRKITMKKLVEHFKKRNYKTLILELGCGNGWLCHHLAISLNAEILGLDINETELLQGAKLFGATQNLSFICADVFTVDLKSQSFDFILLASSIQYFSNLKRLISRVLELLKPSGEIHIVDSPIYTSTIKANEAKARSLDYFNSRGVPEMANNYFHHLMVDLKSFNHQVLFMPHSLVSLFKRKILRIPQGIFPWILIKHN